MKLKSPAGLRKSVTGVAIAACTLAAIPAAMADTYAAPYYDSARDVMVTPRVASTTTTSAQPSDSYSTPARQPIYGTYYTPPRAAAAPVTPVGVVQSSPGAVGSNSSVYAASAANSMPQTVAAGTAQPYYDPAQDVIVTPSQSGTVPYVGSSRGYSTSAQTSSTFELVVRNGRLVEGPGQIAVDHGSQVTMIVDSDVAAQLRVDGYNLVAPVTPGQPMLLTFVAEQPGRFAYRLGNGREIGVIEVGPPQPSAGMRLGMR